MTRFEDDREGFLARVLEEIPLVESALPPGWTSDPYGDPDQPVGPLERREWERLKRMGRSERVDSLQAPARGRHRSRPNSRSPWLLRKRLWLELRDEERALLDRREGAVLRADEEMRRALPRIEVWLAELAAMDPAAATFCDELAERLRRGESPSGAVRELWERRRDATRLLVDELVTDPLRESLGAVLASGAGSAAEIARAATPLLVAHVRTEHPELSSIPVLFAALTRRLLLAQRNIALPADIEAEPSERREAELEGVGGAITATHRADDSVDPATTPPSTLRAARPAVKQSHESNADVLRWLHEHALEAAGGKPKFEPRLLVGRRDREWVLSSLEIFYQQDLIADVLYVAKTGKEATVYCCTPGPASTVPLLAAKVYRPRMFRSLKNDTIYRENRQQRDLDGRISRKRQQRSGGLSARGRSARVAAWIQYEYETQCAVYEAGADVPMPVAQAGNAVLMEFLGDTQAPAPRLSEARLNLGPGEVERLFERVLRNIELCLDCHRVHGDLSMYNVLYHAGSIWLIDFAQAVDPRSGDETRLLLERDVERMAAYFSQFRLAVDAQAIAARLWANYLHGDPTRCDD